jgi:hypothetical protein
VALTYGKRVYFLGGAKLYGKALFFAFCAKKAEFAEFRFCFGFIEKNFFYFSVVYSVLFAREDRSDGGHTLHNRGAYKFICFLCGHIVSFFAIYKISYFTFGKGFFPFIFRFLSLLQNYKNANGAKSEY